MAGSLFDFEGDDDGEHVCRRQGVQPAPHELEHGCGQPDGIHVLEGNGVQPISGMSLQPLSGDCCANSIASLTRCRSLLGRRKSNFLTARVTNLNSMFAGATSFSGIGLEHWNTSLVTVMASMFSNVRTLTSPTCVLNRRARLCSSHDTRIASDL
jgi:Mycoplasma protein of unknown function, DUF285